MIVARCNVGPLSVYTPSQRMPMQLCNGQVGSRDIECNVMLCKIISRHIGHEIGVDKSGKLDCFAGKLKRWRD
jgi:hypothetical protein